MTTYYLASGLVGFRSSTLRVRHIETLRDGTVNVITADLLDAGTHLSLNPAKLTPFETSVAGVSHTSGLVTLAG